MFRADDSSRIGYGGGVLLLVPKAFNCVLVESISNEYFEFVMVDIFKSSQFLCKFGLIYRTPSADTRISTIVMLDLFRNLFENCKECVILAGDFNYPKIT
jgi:hypothetical protein